jgi:hypothetical protein
MRRKAGTLAAAAVLVAGLAVPAAVGAASVLKSRMTGAQIANDDGGAPRGLARATLRLEDGRSRVCFEIEYSGLGGKATAGYVRHGQPGQTARPAIVLFSGRAASPVTGCVGKVGKRTFAGLSEHPGGYSVDLATAKLPKGAVRGQLRGVGGEQQLEGPPSGGIGK